MDIEDELVEKFLSRITCDRKVIEQIVHQVHIPVGFDIFNIADSITYKENILPA